MTDVEPTDPLALTTPLASTMFGLVALVLFVSLAFSVTHANAVTAFDLRDFADRQRSVTSTGIQFWRVVSLTGSPASMSILTVFGLLWLAWRRRLLLLTAWVTASAGAWLLVEVFKRAIHRARPVGAERFLHGPSLSFPSGHVVGSVVVLGMLAFFVSRFGAMGVTHRRRPVVVASAQVALIAYSRLYLGVHYFSDVIAGLALGALWLVICIEATEFALRAARGRSRSPDSREERERERDRSRTRHG